mgnify:CR=1 FL=1
MSFDVLQEKIREKKNPTVAGLDARIEYVPEYIRKEAFEKYGVGLKGAVEAIWQFNVGLIDALCDIVPAVKPQAAYYENLGWQGMEMLERTIRYAKEKGLHLKGPGSAALTMSGMMLRAQTALDPSTSKLAEMMIQGSTMGTVEMTRRLHQLSDQSDPELVSLGRQLLQTEEQNIQQMKRFL